MGLDSCFEQRHRPNPACKKLRVRGLCWGKQAEGSEQCSFSVLALSTERCICCVCHRAGSSRGPLTAHPAMGHAVSTHSLIFTPSDDRYKSAATAPYANVQMKMNSRHWGTPGCTSAACMHLFGNVMLKPAFWAHLRVSAPEQHEIFRCVNSWMLGLVFLAEEPRSLGWKKQPSGLTKFLPWA